MLEADAAHVVAEGQQEVIVIVVVRAVEFVGLLHESAVRFELLRLDLQQIRAVGHDVQMNRRGAARVEVQALEIASGEHRRIHQRVERYRLERGNAGAACGGLQCSRELPALRETNAGLHHDLPRKIARRIEDHRAPLQVQHLRRHHHAALRRIDGRDELEIDVQGRGARGYAT